MRACSSSRKVASIASFPRRQESKNVFRNLWKGFLWSLDIGGRLSLSRKHLFLHYGSNLGQNFINGPDKLETTGIFPECRCLSERRRYVSTLVVFSQVLQISKKKKKLVVRWKRVTQEPRKASIFDWRTFSALRSVVQRRWFTERRLAEASFDSLSAFQSWDDVCSTSRIKLKVTTALLVAFSQTDHYKKTFWQFWLMPVRKSLPLSQIRTGGSSTDITYLGIGCLKLSVGLTVWAWARAMSLSYHNVLNGSGFRLY